MKTENIIIGEEYASGNFIGKAVAKGLSVETGYRRTMNVGVQLEVTETRSDSVKLQVGMIVQRLSRDVDGPAQALRDRWAATDALEARESERRKAVAAALTRLRKVVVVEGRIYGIRPVYEIYYDVIFTTDEVNEIAALIEGLCR